METIVISDQSAFLLSISRCVCESILYMYTMNDLSGMPLNEFRNDGIKETEMNDQCVC